MHFKVQLMMISSVFLVSVCQPLRFPKIRLFRSSEPDNTSTPADFATSYGYYAETHYVLTPDGYSLGLHRVLSPTIDLKKSSPEPFILQHGLVSNSGQFCILEPKQNLAFMLADNGFDVWMTNIRGNMFSRKHERLSPESGEFWNYSWFEHGTIDMPAIIDYILNKTKHSQVWYSGHSMGTTLFFVMASMRPEYNKKIRHMFAMAPVAYMSHLKSPLKQLAPQARPLEAIGRSALNSHVDPEFIMDHTARLGLCGTVPWVCKEAGNAMMGHNPRANATAFQKAVRYVPDVATIGQMAHYGQLMLQEFTFRQYDYYEQNNQKYGSPEPPPYPVHRITAPMTFMYSKNDFLAAVSDVEEFSKALKHVRMFVISDPKFNHADFLVSTYADELVYKPLLKMIDEIRRTEKQGGKPM